MRKIETQQHTINTQKTLWVFWVFIALWLLIPAGKADATVDIITTGSTSPWTVPAGIYSVTVECWGGGGGGGKGNSATTPAAGGGGGAYAKTQLSVTPGQDLSFNIGVGGAGASGGSDDGDPGATTTFNGSSCLAVGGEGGGGSDTGNNPGSGGSADNSIGDLTIAGSDGSAGVIDQGGSGGSGGGPGGGSGGAGGPLQGYSGSPGSEPGGAGGGGATKTGGAESGGDGAAGQIRLTYSKDVTYSGTLYSDEGQTQITSGRIIKVAVGTSTPPTIYSTSTDSGAGTFTFTFTEGHGITATTSLVFWVDGTTTAATVVRAGGAVSASGIDLYQDRVIVRNEGSVTASIEDFAIYDAGGNSNIPFTATTTGTDSLVVHAGNELYLWPESTFTPRGTVTVNGNSGSGLDGSLQLAASSTYEGSTTTIAGNFAASSSASFVAYHGGLIFNATTTGKTIATGGINLGDVTFNSASGGWTFSENASTTDLTITAGTVTGPTSGLTVEGDFENSGGTFNENGGMLYLVGSTGSGTLTGTSALGNLSVTSTSTPNGAAWATTTAAGDDEAWQEVVYGEGLFVAIGDGTAGGSDRVMTSPDGISWTARSAAGDNDGWSGLAYGEGRFVAVGQNTDRLMTSEDGVTWTVRSVAGDDDSWRSVTYGGGRFVAVGIGAIGDHVIYSDDGITWATTTAVGDNDSWLGVTYGQGLFVAVGISGDRVMTSPDGISWTARSAAGDNDSWWDVTYGNGRFVAVSSSGDRVMYSDDGIAWATSTAAGDDDSWHGVEYGAGRFFAAGYSGDNRIMTSLDGITWTPRSVAGDDDAWRAVAYAAGNFVAVSSSGDRAMVSSSTDLSPVTFSNNASTTDFTVAASGEDTDVRLPDNLTIAGDFANYGSIDPNYGTTTFDSNSAQSIGVGATGTSALYNVAFAGSGTKTFTANASTSDFTINSGATVVAPASLTIEGDYNNAGTFTANSGTVHLLGKTATGTMTGSSAFSDLSVNPNGDGATWATTSVPVNNSWLDVTFGGGRFVAVAYSGTDDLVMYSNDGITWASTTPPNNNWWYGITYGAGRFVAVAITGTGDRAMYSDDGISWTAADTTGFDNAWQDVTYGNGRFVAVANSGTGDRVMYSDDGINWTTASTSVANNWTGITYGAGRFVAVASSGTGDRAMYSDDGVTWTTASTPADNSWVDVTYGNGRFVAVANTGTGDRAMYSDDGIAWATTTTSDNSWNRVTYGNGRFVAVATSGTGDRAMYSNDGVNWTLSTTPEDNSWRSVTYGNGRFVAVAQSGTNRAMYATFGTTTLGASASTTGTFTIDEGGDTVIFPAAATSTFTNIDWEGDTTDDVILRSSSDGTQWNVVVSGTQNVNYVNAKDSNACGGNDIYYENSTVANVSCWFSNNEVTISGTLYTEEGTTPITDGRTIKMIIGTSTPSIHATTTDSGAATFTFSAFKQANLPADTPIILYVDGASTTKASTVTVASSSNPISGIDLYRNTTIVRNEYDQGEGTTTIATMASYHGTPGTTSLPYAASSTSGFLELDPDQELHIWSGDAFDAGTGRVTTAAAPTTTGIALHVDDGATFTAGGTTTIQGGALRIDPGATFVAPGSDPLYVDGTFDNAGTFTHNSGDTYLYGTTASGTMTGTSAFNNLTLNHASNATTWTTIPAAGDDDSWYGVTYGKGRFVAVSNSGDDRAMYSDDGVTWATTSAAGDNDSWRVVTYGAGRFVAVSSLGDRVMYSDDGVTWATTSAAGDNDGWYGVTYGDGRFVAVGSGSSDRVMYSDDGVTWATTSAAGDNDTWNSVTYGNGRFVAVGIIGDDRVMYSDDGITWTAITAAGDDDLWYDVTYGNGRFVAVSQSGDRVMYSDDGISWATTSAAGDNDGWQGVTFGGGRFVAVGASGDRVMYSDDGISWATTSAAGDNDGWYGVTYGDGRFVAVGYSGDRVMYATAGGEVTFLDNASTTDFTVEEDTVVFPGQLSIAGNYTNNGTSTAGSGTTTFNGTSQQTASGTMTGVSAFANLTLTNISQSGSTTQSVVLEDVASTTGTLTMVASTSLQLPAAATSTFQNINLTGAADQYVYLRSSVPGTGYGFAVPGTEESVSYVDVRDAESCGTPITASDSIDSGGTACWTFAGAGIDPTIVSAADQTFALNQSETAIAEITVTDAETPTITAANDLRIVIATGTVDMEWDTTDTEATLGGDGAASTSATVSYEGGGSVLVLDVTDDFVASGDLTVSGLSFTNFNATNSAASALSVRTGGTADTEDDATDSKTVTITGSLTLANHDAGQVDDGFGGTNNTDIELFAFKLTPNGEDMTISELVLTLNGIRRIESGDITNVKLYRDLDDSQTVTAGDVEVGGAGTPSISGQSGTITFSSSFAATTSQNYLVVGDATGISPNNYMTVYLNPANVTATGDQTSESITVAGSAATIQHIRGGGGGGGGVQAGSIPEGDGDVGGGGQGGGGTVDPDSGNTIGNENGFEAPTTQGSPLNEWTNGVNGLQSDGNYATAATADFDQDYATFNFNVPVGNQIDGIEVKLELSASTNAGSVEVALSYDGGNNYTSIQSTPTASTTDAVYRLGGQTNDWNYGSWDADSFSNNNFRVRVTAQPSGGNTIRLDALQVRVYHQTTGGGGGGGGEVSIPSGQHYASASAAAPTFFQYLFDLFQGWLHRS